MRHIEKTVFISYRRANAPWALAIFKELTHHGYDAFFDYTGTWRTTWSASSKLTRLAEKGQPEWVIQAQIGHVSPAMMRTYSHIRRKALDEAAAALEPSFKLKFPRHRRAEVRALRG